MAKKTKYVYFFGGGKAEGKSQMKALLGGKGANLAEMCNLHLPVPPGFTITTEACDQFYKSGKKWPTGLAEEMDRNIARLEQVTGKTFGHGANPLLVSVRSGAAASMPGMMDTVLNLGLNDQTLRAMIDLTGNERFAWDAYRRFLQMFGDVVLGMEHEHFEHAIQGAKDRRGVKLDTELGVDGLKEVVQAYKGVYDRDGKAFPRTRASSSATPSTRSSAPGTMSGRSATANSTTSAAFSARPSTCRRWSSATWATPAARAWPSRATPPPAKTSSTAST